MPTIDLPQSFPTEILTGETLQWERDFEDYPADEWTVTYYVRGAGTGFDAAGTADGDTHQFTVSATTTGAMTAGRYDFQAFAVKGSEKYLVDSGRIIVKASLAALTSTSTTYDGRTQAKKILDAIDALMLGKASLDQQKYLIATGVPGFTSQREAERIDPEQLLALRKYYARIVRRELGKGRDFQTIYAQFDPV